MIIFEEKGEFMRIRLSTCLIVTLLFMLCGCANTNDHQVKNKFKDNYDLINKSILELSEFENPFYISTTTNNAISDNVISGLYIQYESESKEDGSLIYKNTPLDNETLMSLFTQNIIDNITGDENTFTYNFINDKNDDNAYGFYYSVDGEPKNIISRYDLTKEGDAWVWEGTDGAVDGYSYITSNLKDNFYSFNASYGNNDG